MNYRKISIIFGLLLLSGLLFACSSSEEDSQPSLKIDSVSVSPETIVRGQKDLFVSWYVSRKHISSYTVSIYLSNDASLDDRDNLLFKGDYNTDYGNISLATASIYPNRYFLILKVEADATEEINSIRDVYSIPLTIVSPKKKWTLMIYMAGDNSLSDYTSEDLLEITNIGSSADVNVVVLADTRYGSGKIYFADPYNLVELQDLGEINMASAQNLINFARYNFEIYPAEHYFLILWDHGWGFSPPRKDLLQDENPHNSWMDIPTLATALSEIKNFLGRPIDIIGFDACLMGMFEVAYDIRSTAFFMVASENFEWGSGWNYQLVLEKLLNNPDMPPYTLAQKTVEAFAEAYQDEEEATLSAVDLSLMAEINNTFNTLIDALNLSNDTDAKTFLAGTIFDQVQRFDDEEPYYEYDTTDTYVDLYHFVDLIERYLPEVSVYSQEVKAAIKRAVIANWYASPVVANAHGLSLWFPNPINFSTDEWNTLWQHYLALDFATNSKWPQALQEIWGL